MCGSKGTKRIWKTGWKREKRKDERREKVVIEHWFCAKRCQGKEDEDRIQMTTKAMFSKTAENTNLSLISKKKRQGRKAYKIFIKNVTDRGRIKMRKEREKSEPTNKRNKWTNIMKNEREKKMNKMKEYKWTNEKKKERNEQTK